MKFKQLNQLAHMPLITKEAIRLYEPKPSNLRFNLYTWLKRGDLIRLKRGLYLLKSNWLQADDKQDYLEYIANQLYQPSYISGEYVLTQYNLLTESTFAITSVTTNKTTVFNNKLGKFSYSSITPALFTGFKVKNSRFGPILIATKDKAMFDYLYFRFLRGVPINQSTLQNLRLNWENISRSEFRRIKTYANLSKSRRINQLIKLIQEKYYV